MAYLDEVWDQVRDKVSVPISCGLIYWERVGTSVSPVLVTGDFEAIRYLTDIGET